MKAGWFSETQPSEAKAVLQMENRDEHIKRGKDELDGSSVVAEEKRIPQDVASSDKKVIGLKKRKEKLIQHD